MSDLPIGIFDSGVGGTSIWKEIQELLPFERTIYLADSKNAPYGPKGKERITEFCTKNTELLINKGCKLVVVACNTATTNAIEYLRKQYDIPFIGIEPAIKPAALKTNTNTIGILATKGTLSSALFSKTSTLFTSGINVIEQEGEGIVQLIERGELYSQKMTALLNHYITPMIKANIDHLVLGCTHYPFLIPKLMELLPKHIKIIDSGEAVAKQTKNILEHHNLLNTIVTKKNPIFYSNDNPDVIADLLGNSIDVRYLDF